MPTFRFKIAVPGGKIKEKTAIADSKASLKQKLESDGNFVLNISRTGGSQFFSLHLQRGRRITTRDFFSFNQEFAVLLKAGLSVVSALNAIIENNEDGELRDLLQEVRQDITAGESLSGSFEKFSHLFSKLYVMTLKAGEKSGDIPTALLRYVEYMKKTAELRRKVISASIYPVILMVVSISVVFFLMIYVVPAISGAFLESGNRLPEITRLLIDISTLVRNYFFYLLAATIGLGIIGFYIGRTDAGRLFFDQMKINMLYFGELYRNYSTSKFSRTLSTLLGAGIPLLEAVQIAADTIHNQFLKFKLAQVVKNLAEGAGFSESLRRFDTLPPLAVRMIDAGETGGALTPVLIDIADFYDNDVDAKLSVLTSAIEPTLMVVMGLVIGSIVLALYLPIFQLAGNVG